MKDNISIIKNYIYNIGLTVLNILFPIITFPYATRALGASGIGRVAFANSIVNYFLMFASLGIPVYAIREIAKVRNNKLEVSKIFTEIFIINFVSTIIFSILYYLMINTFNFYQNEKLLFNVVGILLALNLINIDWLYQGFEQYRFITIRSLIFKIVSLGLLVMMVRNHNDYIKYAFLSIIAQSGSNFINIIYSRNFITISLKDINYKKHMRSILILFFMGLAINVYNNLDSTILGLKAGAVYVGYYTAAIKINKLVVSVVTSLGVVLLPRLSYYIKQNNRDEFNSLIYKSINYVLLISIPICAGLYFLAPDIINLFSGKEFSLSITAMRINIPSILFIAVANITSLQILLPMKKEKQVMYTNILGAIVNLTLNFIFIPKLKHNGAAISSCLSEFAVATSQVYFCRNYFGKILRKLNILNYFIGSAIISFELLIISSSRQSDFNTIIISMLITIPTYFIFLSFKKDELIASIFRYINKKTVREI